MSSDLVTNLVSKVEPLRASFRSQSRGISAWMVVACFALLFSEMLFAQSLLPGSAGAGEPISTVDPFSRETPRSLATQMVNAFASGDYARAAHYIELAPGLSSERRAKSAIRLQQQLDRRGALQPFVALSNDPAGVIDDGLPIDQERIGGFRTLTGELPLIARRVSRPGDAPYWVVSAASLAAAKNVSDAPTPGDKRWLPTPLWELSFAGAPVMDWLILVALVMGLFFGMRLFFYLLLRIIRLWTHNPDTHRGFQFAEAAFPPLGLYLAVIGLFYATQQMQVAIVARQVLVRYAGIVGWFAFVWFLWRLIDMGAEIWSGRMARADRRRALAALVFARRSAKTALVMIAFVAVLDTIGINVTTGIAALGLGGLAIALGAQKSIENLVGSLAVIIDQPVRVGDFCKVGDVLGTVEDIGMRSSQLRTNARTVVTIPNGDFSSKQIENYSSRDRFLLDPKIGLTYDTSVAQMRAVLAAIRTLLNDDPNVIDGARVHFVRYSESSLDIEVFAYIRACDYEQFLGMREELLLTIMETIANADASIAFPTRTIVMKAPCPVELQSQLAPKAPDDSSDVAIGPAV